MPKIDTKYWRWETDHEMVPPEKEGGDWTWQKKKPSLEESFRKRQQEKAAAAQNKPAPQTMFMAPPKEMKGGSSVETAAQSKTGSVKKKTMGGELSTDGSIVDFLKSVGRKAGVGDKLATFDMRRHIYETYDLGQDDDAYTGSAQQNMHLLKTLKKEYASAPDDLLDELAGALKKRKDNPKNLTPQDEQDEQHLKEENGYDIDPVDIEDGTWDSYVESIKKKRGGPSFAEYKRGKAANLLT